MFFYDADSIKQDFEKYGLVEFSQMDETNKNMKNKPPSILSLLSVRKNYRTTSYWKKSPYSVKLHYKATFLVNLIGGVYQMKRMIITILSLFPVPFLFHFYEYNCHLARQDADFLFPVFLLFTIVVGIISRNRKMSLFFSLNFVMTILSLVFGYFLIADDGGWFKPVGRDGAIIFVSIIYIVGQLIIRELSKFILTDKGNGN